jgi:excisionase family DNA binding protein
VNESGVPITERLRGRCTCSIEEAAAVLGIGRSTAYAAAHDGSLPVLRISHRILVSVPRLLAMLGVDAAAED